MAVNVLAIFKIGKTVAPLIGGVIRVGGKLLGSKSADKKATAVQETLERNPKTTTGILTAIVILLGKLFFPGQMDAILDVLKDILPEITEAVTEAE